MSITSALNSAVSGLAASARNADVISSNLANVLTPGYGPRQLELQTRDQGLSGVQVVGVTRAVDMGIVMDRRAADSERGFADTKARFLGAVERVIGTPDDPSSLAARLSAFEAGLVSASANPENASALRTAVTRGSELTAALHRASTEVQRQRTEADGAIGQAVNRLNELLVEIRNFNVQISTHSARDSYAASLQDQRQALVDQVSEYIPVRQVPRENGAIALFTPGGAILLDGNPATLGFDTANIVAPHMTLGNGLLSGLTINGITVPSSGSGSPVDGGRLAALFTVRDDLAPDAQAQLDAAARDLIERFQDPALDATRAPGDPGLLADGGLAFAAINEVGISGRIAVNAMVNPEQGGAAWRLRDGLGAVAEGAPGNGSLIAQLAQALGDGRSLASGDLGSGPRSAAGHLAAMNTRLGQDRLTADQALSFATARHSELVEMELQTGVDSDAEMQKLLLIEQAYAANARMIQTIDDMMQTILRI